MHLIEQMARSICARLRHTSAKNALRSAFQTNVRLAPEATTVILLPLSYRGRRCTLQTKKPAMATGKPSVNQETASQMPSPSRADASPAVLMIPISKSINNISLAELTGFLRPVIASAPRRLDRQHAVCINDTEAFEPNFRFVNQRQTPLTRTTIAIRSKSAHRIFSGNPP